MKQAAAYECEPAVADTLDLLLPHRQTTLLLRAGLASGIAVADAWQQWLDETADPKAFLGADRIGIKRHLPRVYRNLTRHQVPIDRRLEPYLRAARAREEMRSDRFRRYLQTALEALHGAAVPILLGKGVTLGELVLDDPVLRHTHDVDLIVPGDRIFEAMAALDNAGFSPSPHGQSHGKVRADHESGLPIELHKGAYCTPFYGTGPRELWDRSREAQVLGVPVRTMSVPDLLVHIGAHASTVVQRHALSWIVDLVILMQANPQADWDQVVRITQDSQVGLPLYAMYRYLVDEFAAPVPADVLEQLRRTAGCCDGLRFLAALDGLRADSAIRFKTIAAASGPASRRVILRCRLAPPWPYLRWHHPDSPAWLLAGQYVSRPMRYAVKQLRKRVVHMRQASQKGLTEIGPLAENF